MFYKFSQCVMLKHTNTLTFIQLAIFVLPGHFLFPAEIHKLTPRILEQGLDSLPPVIPAKDIVK